jgi:hypothetical protein
MPSFKGVYSMSVSSLTIQEIIINDMHRSVEYIAQLLTVIHTKNTTYGQIHNTIASMLIELSHLEDLKLSGYDVKTCDVYDKIRIDIYRDANTAIRYVMGESRPA